jgi:hypothetical protein
VTDPCWEMVNFFKFTRKKARQGGLLMPMAP